MHLSGTVYNILPYGSFFSREAIFADFTDFETILKNKNHELHGGYGQWPGEIGNKSAKTVFQQICEIWSLEKKGPIQYVYIVYYHITGIYASMIFMRLCEQNWNRTNIICIIYIYSRIATPHVEPRIKKIRKLPFLAKMHRFLCRIYKYMSPVIHVWYTVPGAVLKPGSPAERGFLREKRVWQTSAPSPSPVSHSPPHIPTCTYMYIRIYMYIHSTYMYVLWYIQKLLCMCYTCVMKLML